MRRWWVQLLLGAGGVLLILWGLAALTWTILCEEGCVNLDTTAFEADVRSRIPIGSSREYVEQRLREAGLGGSYNEREHKLVAITKRVRLSPIMLAAIQVFATFDNQDRLFHLDVREALTGL